VSGQLRGAEIKQELTANATYAIDDAGGFDNYILRTPPEELRSTHGERLR